MLNRRILFLTAILMVAIGAVAIGGAAAQSAPAEGEYSSILDNMDGDGSASSPYEVTNITQLQAIDGESVTADGATIKTHIEIVSDINASATQSWDGGFNSINFDDTTNGNASSVSVYIDGNGHTISDYYSEEGAIINNTQKAEYGNPSGLEFNGEINNLKIDSPVVRGYSPGILVQSTGGSIYQNFSISNIQATDIFIQKQNYTGAGLLSNVHLNRSVNVEVSGDIRGDGDPVPLETSDAEEVYGITDYDIYNGRNIDVDISANHTENNFVGVSGGLYNTTNVDVNLETVGDPTEMGDIYGVTDVGDNISDVSVNLSVEGDEEIGGVSEGDISNLSNVEVNIDATTNGDVVGGIVAGGNLEDSENLNVEANLEGQSEIGGLVGDGSVENLNDVSIDSEVTGYAQEIGGIIGTGDALQMEGIDGSIVVRSYGEDQDEISGISGDGGVSIQNSSLNLEFNSAKEMGDENAGISGDGDVTLNSTYLHIEFDTNGIYDTGDDHGGIAVDNGIDIDSSVVQIEFDDEMKFSLAETGTIENSVILIDGQDPTYDITGNDVTDSYSTLDSSLSPYIHFSENDTKYYQQQEVMNQLDFSEFSESNGAYPIVSQAPVGPQSTGPIQAQIESVEIDQNVTASEDTEVAVEFDPDTVGPVDNHEVQVIQDGEVLASGEIEDETEYLTWDSTNQTGSQNLTVETGDESQNFTINVVAAGGGEDTLFSSFDIPGTDISVPLLPVGGILVIGILGVGYIYYREEEVDFQ